MRAAPKQRGRFTTAAAEFSSNPDRLTLMNSSDAFFELKRQFAVATMTYARAVEETKDIAASIGVSFSREKLQEFNGMYSARGIRQTTLRSGQREIFQKAGRLHVGCVNLV
jgi:hypothetical protein